MAIVPSNTRFVGISSSVDLKERKSSLINSETQPYTIEDIAQTVGGGGGGFGDFVIEANGTMGPSFNVGYQLNAAVPSVQNGINVYPVKSYPSLSLYGNQGYGTTFTATEVSFPGLTEASYVNLNNTPLVIIDLPDLTSVAGSMAYFSMNQNQLLTTLLAPSLVSADNINISNNPTLVNINFESLVNVAQQFNVENTSITQLTSAELPVLENVGTLQFSTVTSINLPSVKKIANINAYGSNLTSMAFPNTIHLTGYGFYFSQKVALTSVVLGTVGTLKQITNSSASIVSGFSIDFSSCSLDEASVNGIAILMASLDGTNGACTANSGTMYLNGGSNAAPSGSGAAAIQTLLGRGWMIATN